MILYFIKTLLERGAFTSGLRLQTCTNSRISCPILQKKMRSSWHAATYASSTSAHHVIALSNIQEILLPEVGPNKGPPLPLTISHLFIQNMDNRDNYITYIIILMTTRFLDVTKHKYACSVCISCHARAAWVSTASGCKKNEKQTSHRPLWKTVPFPDRPVDLFDCTGWPPRDAAGFRYG